MCNLTFYFIEFYCVFQGTETVVINDDDDDDIISDDDEVQIVHVTTGDPINISDDEDDDIVVPPVSCKKIEQKQT